MKSPILALAIVLASAPSLAVAADEIQPTAVLSFDERGKGVQGYGAKVSDVVYASLLTEPKMLLVDRAELKKTLAEQELTVSGLVKTKEAAQVGQLTGAKLIVTGSIIEIDRTMYLVAKVISTETSRVLGAKVKGKTSDDLAEMSEKLAAEVAELIEQRGSEIVAKPVKKKDHIAALNKRLGPASRPTLWISVREEHVGARVIDPAAETELALLSEGAGFSLIDAKEGSRADADILIQGEAFSETATRVGRLVSVKARVEVKAVDRKTGKLLASDRQTEIVVGAAERIAGKTALQNAAAKIAERMLPKLVKKQGVAKR